ncbi:MAG: hypothetical protein COB50_05470 [Thiotrichales bacterium]|nr:MAG: hypothetical protein COB50_05470 [Thiotrichales bacterium]
MLNKKFYLHFAPAIIIYLLLGVLLLAITKSAASLYVFASLALFEIAMSFDNAVINAKVLSTMPPVWQKIFIYLGIPVAVFVVRFLLPIALVYLVTHLSLHQVLHAALNQPDVYKTALQQGYPLIAAFGATFLFMLFASFLLQTKREITWWNWLEQHKIIKILHNNLALKIILLVLIFAITFGITNNYEILIAMSAGVGCFLLLHTAQQPCNIGSACKNMAFSGLRGFIYLEILDASFSLDGVLGAFAISNNIFVIMAGLGAGAVFVRSITIYLLRNNTLQKLRYLEHGAYYAIFVLATFMLLKTMWHIPELLIASSSILILLFAIYGSWRGSKV